MSKVSTREVAYAAVFTGLVFVATAAIVVPIPATQGYFNLGESMIYFAALLLGPFVASLAGGFGSMLADLYLGYPQYAPATLVIKGVEGFLVAALFAVFSKSRSRVLAGAGAAAVIAAAYTIAALRYAGAQLAIPVVFIVLQLIAIAVSFKNVEAAAAIAACGIGGVEMVTGYFLYETLLYGYYAALVEVPANYGQSLFGTLIAIVLYKSLKSFVKK